MGSFYLTKMSLRNLFKKPATKMYPVAAPVYTPMTKGHVENDIETCILCGICEKKCPTLAIVVDKPAETWTIDPFACIQCYTCIRACPKSSLTMLPQYTGASTGKYLRSVTKPEPTPEEKAAREAAAREKEARIAAAKAAKAAKTEAGQGQ
ncbi:MAG: 4Fe-4S binding protein [Coriobacteriales bacterium]|jgi:formate hydrogenlyase subunit 6/NADH:ubiquinone oxidoreductase subunit I|nr:4Fe-4S binding protein [Coriobacteriales bacterium]